MAAVILFAHDAVAALPIPTKPSNDDFASATALPDVVLGRTFSYSSESATLEPGEAEQFHVATAAGSVWWKWTPRFAALTALTSPSGVTVYKGTALSNLQSVFRVPSGPIFDPIYPQGFVAEPGVTYWIRPTSYLLRAEAAVTSSWTLTQFIHAVEPVASRSGQPVFFNLKSAGRSELPRLLRVSVIGQPDVPWLNSIEISPTVTVQNPSLGTFWSWTPSQPGRYRLVVTAEYASGDKWTRLFGFQVRSANDDFGAAEEIPPDFTTGEIGYRTDYSTSEPLEPPYPAGTQTRGVWWRWTPSTDRAVRLSADQRPLEIFTGIDLASLTRVAHNDGRTTSWPFEGLVGLNARGGETYFIRVSTKEIGDFTPGGSLKIEPLEAPARGFVNFSTAALGEDGAWKVFGRIRWLDGGTTRPIHLSGQFVVGAKLQELYAASHGPFSVRDIIEDQPDLAGTYSEGILHTGGIFGGEELYVQLRVWSEAYSYQNARENGKVIGRSKILKMKAGSELAGIATLEGLGDIQLFQASAFNPGEFVLENKQGPAWKLQGFPGMYLIEGSNLRGPWKAITVLDLSRGAATYIDDRAEKGEMQIYRSQLLD